MSCSLLQLDSADEQAAAIRRELDGRIQKCNEMEKVSPHLGFKGLGSTFRAPKEKNVRERTASHQRLLELA